MNITFLSHNPFPNKPWFLRVCSTVRLKTLWEKEKLLVKSNFSFSHSIFYSFREFSAIFVKFEIVVCIRFQFGRVYNLPFGKGLTQNVFYCLFVSCVFFYNEMSCKDQVTRVKKDKMMHISYNIFQYHTCEKFARH